MKNIPKILIVDDQVGNLIVLEKLLGNLNVELIRATSGNEALTKTLEHNFSLVLLDVQMPEMDGYETLSLIRLNKNTEFLPVIFISAIYSEKQDLIKGIETGAVDFIVKPIVPQILIGKVNIFLNLNKQKVKLENEIGRREDAEIIMQNSIESLNSIMTGIMNAISLIVEAKDPYTAGHQTKVGKIAIAIAEEMGHNDLLDCIKMAASIHDLGKIHVPSEILCKPGKITNDEFELIKLHPEIGYEILKKIDFPWPIAKIIYQHHERINGSGYPNGITGEEMLIESKILAISDVVEAMSAHRPYRAALEIDIALEEIYKNKEILYDSDSVDACIEVIKKNKREILQVIKGK